MLFRPGGVSEWIWALGGASLLAILGLVPLSDVARAVGEGTDVYFFLAGMMLLAEVARREGVFAWVAGHAVLASGGSRFRLFAIVYGACVLVTVVLSNDATAVVLTPAVAAAVRTARTDPRPYLFACAFVANAASFVLPISNPANLVVFARELPSLRAWLATFGVPSAFAIGATFVVLAAISRRTLRGAVVRDAARPALAPAGRLAVAGVGLTACALVVASAVGAPLGRITFACGAVVLGVACLRDRAVFSEVVASVSWSVLALVAGLFVLVRGFERTGSLEVARHAIRAMATWPAPLAVIGAAGATALLANLTNNLPAGLIAGASVATLPGHAAVRSAVAIGIDLGPNLSVTGSLATVLWLVALRRERIEIDAWTFLRAGSLVMPAALVLAAESLVLTAR